MTGRIGTGRLAGLLAALCFIGLLAGCQMFPREAAQPSLPLRDSYAPQEYPVTAVQRGMLTISEQITCKYIAASSQELCFSQEGKTIGGIYVTAGQKVRAGDLVAELALDNVLDQIETLEYDIDVLECRSYYIWRNRELEMELCDVRQSSEAQRQAVTQKYRDQLRAVEDQLTVKKMQLEVQMGLLEGGRLYAGMDGTVTYAKRYNTGDTSIIGQQIVTIADMDTTAFAVTGPQAALLHTGDSFTVLCGNVERSATVTEAEALGFAPAEDTVYLQLQQPDPTLKSGSTGTFEVILETKEDVLFVEKSAVWTSDGKQFVFILDENGLRTTCQVTTGAENKTFVQILAGLSEGQRVILP